ncbi:MAG: IPT/TIG domain-containing protein [Bacteroidota bacterium]
MSLASLARLAPLALLLAVAGCDTSDGPTLFDPDRQTAPDPTVTSVSPAGSALAGIDEVTITGTNFSATASDNLVFFDDAAAEILSASPTELRVKVPNTPAENLAMRVSVRSAANYSTPLAYTLVPAVVEFGELANSETPFGITTDPTGNLYLSINSDGTRSITRIAADGTRSPFFSTTFEFPGLSFGPDGALYGVRGVFAAFRLPEAGTQETFGVISDGRPLLTTIDTDANGNLYVGGNNATGTNSIYRIASDKSVTAYALPGNVRALTVFDGAVYAAVTLDGVSQVFRLAADASGDLGAPTSYVNMTALAGAEATALAFAASGDLYVGTDALMDPVYLVRPDGSGEVLYPGVLTGPTSHLAYGPGSFLYMRTADVLNAENAVIQPAGLFRIETRQDGAR